MFYRLLFIVLLMASRLSAQQLTESNLPIIDIKTNGQEIPDEPKITATLRFIHGTTGINRVTDSANLYYGNMGIELRGSTSQSISAKKPYGIELRDAMGVEKPVGFFGWTKMEDWALIAPYSDKTLMRDALTYFLAGSFMTYAPKTRFCELVLNGQYQGVYVLTENTKRKRLNISKADPTAVSGDALTGGYILKIDKSTGENWGYPLGFNATYTNSNGKNTFYTYDYPDPEDITISQEKYIQGLMREFEIALMSEKFSSDTEGYAKYFDVQSLVDFFIMNELTRNVDGYRLSTYFYKDKNSVNSKFRMGPVWDFNIALGNADYCQGGLSTGWAYKFNSVCPDDGWGIPFWWERLLQDYNFKKKLQSRWFQLRQEQLKTSRVFTVIDSFKTVLNDAQSRNFKKWNILNMYVWPNNKVTGSYEGEVNYLKTWLTERFAWLDAQFSLLKTTETIGVEGSLEVTPNPAKAENEVQFSYKLLNSAKVKLNIYNTTGQLVHQIETQQMAGSNQLKWSQSQQKGIYIYSLYLNDELWQSGRVVKM